MPPRSICVTGDPILRRTLRRTLQAAGCTVEFANAPSDLVGLTEPPELVVLDREARRDAGMDQLKASLGQGTKIVVLGESLEQDEIVHMLRDVSFDHVISDGPDLDEIELVVTSVKLIRGDDIFGLEKYLAWGVTVHEREVVDYDDKRNALLEVAELSKEAGVRRQLVARIESVADELLMNALYDAPAVRFGVRPRIGERARAGLGPIGNETALLRYACDGRYFALSVKDNYGELRKDAILDHLARARREKGSPRLASHDGSGAGLGLYFVLSSATRFIANIDPGVATEVVALFDMKATGRELHSCARSLHIFTAARPSSAAPRADTEPGPTTPRAKA